MVVPEKEEADRGSKQVSLSWREVASYENYRDRDRTEFWCQGLEEL